ncbi:hypothetical protein Lalb_Chr01g0018181 [Lupinus albus]|uniref:Uncharacterized protein n=1 Tax=Lupinus albus TaxID=3870 RepID=A0A6A4R6W9_LUPAL|nr:hypothetical protein Lalb_Chr01g0018181 [Lupinus albus]
MKYLSMLNIVNELLLGEFCFLPWQAYTVELEAELNILREENNQLKQELVLPNNINFLSPFLNLFVTKYYRNIFYILQAELERRKRK